MFLKKTVLKNFRCHKDLSLEFSLNPFYISGGNGSGKTSVAEAVYTLLTLKSFRKINIKDAISHGEDNLRISAVFDIGEAEKELVYFYSDARRLLIDGEETASGADFSYIVPIICYSPGFETLFSNDQQERRASLDRIIYYTDKRHIEAVKLYNALISRKRAELISEKPDREVLSAIDDRLAPVSVNISKARRDTVELINSGLFSDPLYEKLLPGGLKLVLDVSPMKRDPAELRAKRPLDGCHKDLLYLKKDGCPAEKFQSFGQKKSALLFILHQVSKIIEKFRKQGIILILDDFTAGLDKNRINLFEGLLPNSDGLNRQIILTGVELSADKAALTL
jgi:DNA replication and repair protein RecF